MRLGDFSSGAGSPCVTTFKLDTGSSWVPPGRKRQIRKRLLKGAFRLVLEPRGFELTEERLRSSERRFLVR